MRQETAIERPSGSLRTEYLSIEDLARELNRSPRTIARWHTARIGPPRIKVKKLILYKRSDVERWLSQQVETN